MKHCSNWDEFQWERELRNHENRIARYFQGLVYCIDLPAEEACADFRFGSAAPSDPVSTCNVNNQALQEWLQEHDADEEDADNPPERHPTCFAPVDAVDQLAVTWNIICASRLHHDFRADGMGITCAFAQLLARVADFTEPGRDCTAPLLITLGKRSLTDLKELCCRLELIGMEQPELRPDVAAICARLLLVREQLLTALNELRASCQSGE